MTSRLVKLLSGLGRRSQWATVPQREVSGAVAGAVRRGGRRPGRCAVTGGGHEVAVDLVGDLDALVAEPAGHLGDRNAVG